MTVNEPVSPERRARPPGPEVIGGALAFVVVAIVATTVFAMGPPPPATPSSPLPSRSAGVETVTPSPLVDPGAVILLQAVNERLAGFGRGLQRELDRTNLRTNEVASLVRQVNTTVALGGDAVVALNGAQGEDEPGGKLAALYKSIGDSATQTLRASLANTADYRVGATVLVKFIAEIPALQAALEALAEGPPPSPSAPASAAPSASVAPPASSPPPASATPPPASATAPPSGPVGSLEPSPAPDEQIEGGGFETGVGPPWGLFVATGASATLAPDTVAPAAGTTSAKVDIGIESFAYSGVSLRQPGLQIEAGRHYSLSLWVRAETPRDLRVRIGSSVGASYLARSAPVTTAWTQVVFPFIASVTDPNAALEIELGRSDVTTWVDTVSFRPATGT
ncbi:MAG TPA: carbohydrate binding domain-containing protein [Candidatus Limnocylindrales bacterium]|nr:carbohydrate binding domain-containing protein [Candidatus Limnocylindrales bacterium]